MFTARDPATTIITAAGRGGSEKRKSSNKGENTLMRTVTKYDNFMVSENKYLTEQFFELT